MFTVTMATNSASMTPERPPQHKAQSDKVKNISSREDYSQKQRRERAQAILDNYQLLMDYAVANGKVALLSPSRSND
ncbi:hypothetical protein A1O1_06809, partial [Capronia coronata CBS 617.96]